MPKFAFAVPVLPDKRAVYNEITAHSREHIDEYRASRERAGITLERVSYMPTPMGDFAIPYVEGHGDFNDVLVAFQTGGEFDRWFLEKNSEVTGIDFASMRVPAPAPRLIGEWIDPLASDRRAFIGFCAPLAPGKGSDARAFARAAYEVRADELAESRRRLGITHESVFLHETPMGEIVTVYLEGDDPQGGNRRFAESREPFDVWFKGECKTIFIPEVDFNIPLPPIRVEWDWEAAREGATSATAM